MEYNLFKLCLILTIIAISIITYISISSPSKEEYVEIYLTDYTKEVNTNNFTFDFSIKSYYFSRKDFEINLYLNETILNNKTLNIGPREKIDIKENIHLPTNETYLVKVFVRPLDEQKEAYIYFWINDRSKRYS
jgi:hypothetical protein